MKQISNLLQEKLKEFSKIKPKLEKSLQKNAELEGYLVLSASHGRQQYHHVDHEKKKHYISTKNTKLISALAQKSYDQALQKELLKQETQIEKVLNLLPLQNISDIYENLDPRRKPFVTPHFLTDEQYVERWLSFKYEGKPGYDEGLTHTTDRGEKVRSKSEKIIADKLYALGIPYRYEYPVHIKGYGTVYIDFVILDVKTRKEIYYEHFGKMDDPDYINKNLPKLQSYPQNGIVLGKNFIATFESSKHPFDISTLEIMLQELLA